MSILTPVQINTRPKKKVTKIIDSRATFTDEDEISVISAYYSPDAFIKNSLFLVQSDNIFNQPTKRPLLYQLFYTSVQYVVNFIKCRMTIKVAPLIKNPNLNEGWYLMPLDFAGWAVNPVPPYYRFDEFGNWSFAFADTLGKHMSVFADDSGTEFLQYHQMPPLNGVDSEFLLMLRWHFLREVSLCQNSIAQFAQFIESRYQEYKSLFKTRTNTDNLNLSAGSNQRGFVNPNKVTL